MPSLAARLTLAAAALLCLPAPAGGVPAGAEESGDERVPPAETLVYEWDLGGLLGNLAALFMPGRGSGALTTLPAGEDRLRTELHVTSPRSRQGDFWLYGAEIEPAGPLTRRVWSSYRFRGEEKDKAAELADGTVVDVVSGIFLLREDPPEEPRRMKIWSDGKVYPVVIRPTGEGRRELAGETVRVRGFEVVQDEEAEGRPWDGRLEIHLADDAASTPVEIMMRRGLAHLRLVLAALDAGDPLQLRRRHREVREIRGPGIDPEPMD